MVKAGDIMQIKSVKKATDILTLLADSPENPMRLSEISEKLCLNKATCSHILATLCESLYVEKVSHNEGYRLGAGTFMLTRYGRYQESLIEIATPVMKWLWRQVGHSLVLTVISGGVKYIVLHLDYKSETDCTRSKIKEGHIDTTATGQLLMAYMPPDELEHAQKRLGIIDRDSMNKRLCKIRACGTAYVYNPSEGSHSYAFRITENQRTTAAIGIYFTDSDCTDELVAKVKKYGSIAVHEIERRLKFKKTEDITDV